MLVAPSPCSSLDTSTSGLSGSSVSTQVIPVSNVAYKSAFSTGGRLLDQLRISLTPKLVQVLVFLQDWLRSEKLKQPGSLEEDLDNLEQIEKDFANEGKDPTIVDV
uniref:HAT C-terminal dimerisation domain-containing protein n=1 Tax=Solanum lycopersicum TaxID=4081 RepID=A0A3Q7FFY7_SOLLC